MSTQNRTKKKNYLDIGFDAFLYKGQGSVGKDIKTLSDINSGKTSALRQSNQSEKIDLGQSQSLSIGDGKTTRLFIGNR